MRKVLAYNFLWIALIASSWGVVSIPQNAYGANACGISCSYTELEGYLPGLLQDLQGQLSTLRQNNIPDDIGVQQAINTVQTAINTRTNTPAWIQTGNDAVGIAEATYTRVQTVVNSRSGSTLASQIADAEARGDTVTATRLRAQQTQNSATANGKATPKFCPTGFGWFCDGMWAFAAGIISILVSISAWILGFSGFLFDWLVNHTIILFGAPGKLYDQVKDGINIGWTVFRDLSNIIIIGMFTFIAISTILGIDEYGAKKLLARVLIVAVLINFSLLFTKMIIDASNFTARQFYTQAGTASGPNGGTAQLGISDRLVNIMGISGIGDTYDAVTAAGNTSGRWLAFLNGLFSMSVLLALAVVLLYGSFILVSRALMLLFLLLTSSVAFASHLVPKWSDSGYGWTEWWKSLLGSAVLAPLLMVFIWITLLIGQQMKDRVGGGTLGALITDPKGDANLSSLFLYLVMLGMLFITFKISSKLASGIGGFNLAAMAGALPLALGSRFIVAPILRQTSGRINARRALNLDDEIGEGKRALALIPKGDPRRDAKLEELRTLMKKKDTAEKLSKSSYNAMNTGLAKSATGALGISGFFSGAQAKPQGYGDTVKAIAEKAVKDASSLVISKDDAEKAALDEIRNSDEHKKKELLLLKEKETAETMRTAAQALLEGRRPEQERLDVDHENAKKEVTTVTNDVQIAKGAIERQYGQTIKELTDKMVADTTTPAERADARNKLDAVKAQRESALNEQDNKIKQAESRVKTTENNIKAFQKPLTNAEEALRKAKKDLEDLDASLAKKAKERGAEMVTGSKEAIPDMAERLAHHRLSNILPRVFGEDPGNDTISMKARKEAKKYVKKIPLRERIATLKDLTEEEGDGATKASSSGAEAEHK